MDASIRLREVETMSMPGHEPNPYPDDEEVVQDTGVGPDEDQS